MTQFGVDLSNWQGPLNPADVAALKTAGVVFAYVKATQGTDYINPDAAQQVGTLRAAGIKVGLYHFFNPAQTVSAQAQYFLINAATLGGSDLPVALDSETVDPDGWNNLAAEMVAFVMQVEQEPSVIRNTQSVFYVNGDFYENLPGIPWGRGLWLADPGATSPSHPCLIWQSGERPISGLGNVDWDQFLGSEAQWLVFTGGSASPTTPPVSDPQPTPPSPAPAPESEFDLSTLPNITIGSGTPTPAAVVKSLQALLRDKCDQGQLGVNGTFGAETVQAVKNVQHLFELPETGDVDEALWGVLLLL